MTRTWGRAARFSAALAAGLLAGGSASAQGGVAGQGGLSPQTPTLAPEGPGPSGGPGPRTPLPPRDTPRAPQPGSATAGPTTPLPPRDTPRAPQPGQAAAPAPDPDWPCVQVKVPTLSYGQMWSGPPLDEAMKTWRDDRDVAALVSLLAARRTSKEEAAAALDRFAKAEGDRKKEKLTAVFAGVFEEINAQRSQVMAGITRYSRKQRDLSERIKAESLRLAKDQKSMAAQMSPEGQKEQQALDWDTRIYEERAQSLTYVCETPVILEQRVFELSREIQARLE